MSVNVFGNVFGDVFGDVFVVDSPQGPPDLFGEVFDGVGGIFGNVFEIASPPPPPPPPPPSPSSGGGGGGSGVSLPYWKRKKTNRVATALALMLLTE